MCSMEWDVLKLGELNDEIEPHICLNYIPAGIYLVSFVLYLYVADYLLSSKVIVL